MPKSPNEMRDSFHEWFQSQKGGNVFEISIADYWLQQVAARDAELVKVLEGMKKEVRRNPEIGCPIGEDGFLNEGFNSALDDIINKVSNTEKI